MLNDFIPTVIHEYEDPATGERMYQLENDNLVNADEYDALFAQPDAESMPDELEASE